MFTTNPYIHSNCETFRTFHILNISNISSLWIIQMLQLGIFLFFFPQISNQSGKNRKENSEKKIKYLFIFLQSIEVNKAYENCYMTTFAGKRISFTAAATKWEWFFIVCRREDKMYVLQTQTYARTKYGVACLWGKNVVHLVSEYALKMLQFKSYTYTIRVHVSYQIKIKAFIGIKTIFWW